MYNTLWKLKKYNEPEYDKYFTKFIQTTENGDKYIKPAAIVLYYQQLVAIVIALIFIIKYPVALLQTRAVSKGRKKSGKDGPVI